MKNFICKIFGHKPVGVITYRYHCSGVKGRKHSYEFGSAMKRANKGRWVRMIYTECSRCGKKLTNARRCYGY